MSVSFTKTMKALDDLRERLESLYDDLQEADITETKFREEVIEIATEWADFALRGTTR